MTGLALAAVLSAGSMVTASAAQINLAIVMDGSGSISTSDYALQLDGYKNVFTASDFFSTIVTPSPFDTLNVAVWQFSSDVFQEVAFTAITNQTEASTFGNLFNTTKMPQLDQWTNTEGGILAATAGLTGITLATGDKLVIDVSTDGAPTVCDGGVSGQDDGCGAGETSGSAARAAADAARDNGITVNALGVGRGIGTTFLNALVGINPADTPTGFFLTADSFADFEQTVRIKLGREIGGGVPAPGSLLLLGIGVVALRRVQKGQAAV
jgi:hypothetical protein